MPQGMPPAPIDPAMANDHTQRGRTVLQRFASRVSRPGTDRFLVLALLLMIPALLPLAAPGYFFEAHDGHHSVFWLVEFDAAFRDGAFWPVWAPDHVLGFGYPLWLVYAPFSFFVAEAFHLLGLGFAAAVKAAWALWFVVGAIGIYRLARRWWGPAAALAASLAYTYAPYHLVDIYVRAAFAEFAALALAPWALLALVSVWETPRAKNAVAAALALGVLLLTHSMVPAVFVPVLLGFVLWKVLQAVIPFLRRRKGGDDGQMNGAAKPAVVLPSILWTGTALALGLGLAMIFWLPALLERRFVQEASWLQGTYDYARHFVYPSQFFSAFWGFGYSVPGPDDGMSFQLGLVQWIAAVVAGMAAFGLMRPALRRRRAEALYLLVISLAAVFAMTPAAKPFWDAFPLAGSIQFPWRLLSVTTIALALLLGAAVRWLSDVAGDEDRPSPYVYVVALAIVTASFPYTRPVLVPIRPQDESPLAIVEFEAAYPDMRGMTSFAQRPPAQAESPLIDQYLAGQPLRRAAIFWGTGEVLDQESTANSAWARVRAESDVRLRFYTNYFPGWQATVDGRPAEIAPDPPDGLIGLDLPPGEHEVRLHFGATPVRRVGVVISLVAAMVLAVLVVLDSRKNAWARSRSA